MKEVLLLVLVMICDGGYGNVGDDTSGDGDNGDGINGDDAGINVDINGDGNGIGCIYISSSSIIHLQLQKCF